MVALYFAMQMTLMMFSGFLLRKTNRVNDSFAKPLTRLFIDLVLPCMIINAMATAPFSLETLHNSLILVGLGVAYFLLTGIVVFLITLFRRNDEYVNQHRFAMLMPNFTAMGVPISEAFYGAQGVLYNTMMGLPMRIVLYMSVPFLFRKKCAPAHGLKENLRGILKSLNIPPVYATFIGLILFVTQWRPPELIMSTLGVISKMSLPLGVILCGIVIGGIPKGSKPRWSVLWVSLFRNFAAPALMLGLMLLLRLDPIVSKTAVTMVSLPIAMVYSSFCVAYDAEPQQASLCILVSTALSVVTIPMWHYILEQVF